jgi:hypothetical protein
MFLSCGVFRHHAAYACERLHFTRVRDFLKGEYQLLQVRPPAWNASAPTTLNFYEIWCEYIGFFQNLLRKFKFD